MHVHLPYQGLSPTIPRMVTHLQNMVINLLKDGHLFSIEWSPTFPMMVNHHPQDGHQLSKGMVVHHPQDGPPPTAEWPPTISRRVITFSRTVTNYF